MARNTGKKRGAQPRQSSGGGGKRWPFFVGGLLLGLLLSAGVYLLKILPTALELRDRAKAAEVACADTDGKKAAARNGEANGKAAGEKPVTFEFYSMLPKQEVVAPVNGDKTTTATPVPVPMAVPPSPGADIGKAQGKPVAGGERYQLQAGSFRTRPEADRRRAELVLSGLGVSIQDVTTGKGETWYRVMVGPFGSEADMQKARQQLAGMKIDSLPVRLR